MISCRTQIDSRMVRALADYHIKTKKGSKKNRIMVFSFGIVALILSLINAYGYWKLYYGSAPFFTIALKSSLFVIFSTIILVSAIRGNGPKLAKELARYFAETKTEHLDYVISDKGILMKMNDQETMYSWASINRMEADENYYYFSSNNKHSIITKDGLGAYDITQIDRWMKQIRK